MAVLKFCTKKPCYKCKFKITKMNIEESCKKMWIIRKCWERFFETNWFGIITIVLKLKHPERSVARQSCRWKLEAAGSESRRSRHQLLQLNQTSLFTKPRLQDLFTHFHTPFQAQENARTSYKTVLFLDPRKSIIS